MANAPEMAHAFPGHALHEIFFFLIKSLPIEEVQPEEMQSAQETKRRQAMPEHGGQPPLIKWNIEPDKKTRWRCRMRV